MGDFPLVSSAFRMSFAFAVHILHPALSSEFSRKILHSRVWKDQPEYTQLLALGMLDVLSLFVTFYELLCSAFLHDGMLPEIASKQAFLFKQYCEHSELALLLVIALFRMCAVLFPFKIKLILTPRVAMVSVLSVWLLYGPSAVVLSLDCFVGYKPRVMNY